MWTSNGWFGFKREQLEEALEDNNKTIDEAVDLEESGNIKGWKNAGSDISKWRAAQGKDVKLVRLKKDGTENKMHDATKMFRSAEEAQEHHDRVVGLNPKTKIAHNLYVDGKHVKTLGESVDQIDEISDKKLDAYRQKAFADQPAGDDGSDKYRKRKFGRDLAFDKQVGRAKVRATKEPVSEATKKVKPGHNDVVMSKNLEIIKAAIKSATQKESTDFDAVNKAIVAKHREKLAQDKKKADSDKTDKINKQISSLHTAVSKHVKDFNAKNEALDEAEFKLGGGSSWGEHEANHSEMADLHREMAEKHRKMGGRYNLAAAKEHQLAADAQDNAAEHEYSFQQGSKTYHDKHVPEMKAAKAAFDRASAQSKTAFSASHLLDVEESVGLSEVSMKTLAKYSIKASDASKHRQLPTKKVDQRYAGVYTADQKIRKMEGKPSSAKVAATNKVNEAIYHDVDWDGPSKVKVIRHDANEIDVRRVDKNHKELAGDDHATTYTKHDPEFREIKSKIRAADEHDDWKEKRSASLQGRKYHESVELDESTLTNLIEGTVMHGPYELSSGKPMRGMGEANPSHVHASPTKMSKLGVPAHHKDDYGDTVLINVKDTRTGDKTVHHVYQRGLTDLNNKEGKKVVSVRTVGHARPKSETHGKVIQNYLAGKQYKSLKEEMLEDFILSALVEEALATKRNDSEKE